MWSRPQLRRSLRKTSLLLASLGASAALLPSAEPNYKLRDAAGVEHTPAEWHGDRAAAFVFLEGGCPLSERSIPSLNQLSNSYRKRRIPLFGVSSGKGLATSFPILLDPEHGLARQLGAHVTPEAVVISPSGEVLYQGRIDDRAAELGKSRPAAVRPDLALALEEIASGNPVSVPRTRAVGCAIEGLSKRRSPQSARVVWSRDVVPLLTRYCTECHRRGGSAPFSLESYEDARPRASTIAQVVSKRIMPPWKAEPGPIHYEGEVRLAEREIRLLGQWAAAGAPRGGESQPVRGAGGGPALASGTTGSRPITITKPYPVASGGPDEYRCFVIPSGEVQSAGQWVRGFAFVPGNRRVVHHALVFADATGAARKLDAATPELGYPCFGVPGFLPAASFGGWTPGQTAVRYPPGVALGFPKEGDLVMQIHYQPSGKPEVDQSGVSFEWTTEAPTRSLLEIPLGSIDIDIPAGESRYIVRDMFTLPVDVEAVGIIPHAHYICKEIRGFAVLPDRKRLPLITILDWDFNWQRQYRFLKPVMLPMGTVLQAEFVYDNSDANPRNPSSPAVRVKWGPGSKDEMAGLHVQVIPGSIEDREELGQTIWGRLMRSFGGGFLGGRPLAVPQR